MKTNAQTHRTAITADLLGNAFVFRLYALVSIVENYIFDTGPRVLPGLLLGQAF